jgi:hypothetical protein
MNGWIRYCYGAEGFYPQYFNNKQQITMYETCTNETQSRMVLGETTATVPQVFKPEPIIA